MTVLLIRIFFQSKSTDSHTTIYKMSSSVRSISGQSQQTGFLARGNRGAKTADGNRELAFIDMYHNIRLDVAHFLKIFDEM